MAAPSPLKTYQKEVEAALQAGDATEPTHYPSLKKLIEDLGEGITATVNPKQIACGAPDFSISRPTGHGPLTLGYIEAKDVGKSLDEVEKSDQLKRYREGIPNLILTNYLEFRWYVDGEYRRTARLGRISAGKVVLEKEGLQETADLLNDFLAHEPEPIGDPKELAERLARLTHIIRDIIVEAFQKEIASELLNDLRKFFAQALIPDLETVEKTAEFADMYAQTLSYGLFAARFNHEGAEPFTRSGAAKHIPKTNPFLRMLFDKITGVELDDEPYVGFVDDLVSLLALADMHAVLEHFGKKERDKDPVIHFYETYLAAYDPDLREKRGVYYTPEPVVSYIVRSVDYILKERFGCPEGLADTARVEYERGNEKGEKETAESHRVLILDPACGTGTFLYSVVDLIRERFMAQGDAGMWSGYVKNDLLPRLFGFELMMAPYAVAHFKLGMQLAGQDLPSEELREQWAYDFAGGEEDRLRVYLTNTLEGVEESIPDLYGWYKVISDEANYAREVKKDLPIMVIVGNPPYSGHSANLSWKVDEKGKRKRNFIGNLIDEYYYLDGERLKERNPKWLQDDYVKFIRWAQWRIQQTGQGILAFISNNAYLDNPTFRGMRKHLLDTFTDIYILDLHGSSRKRETTPEGGKDENVFDIQQGVAIGLFIKERGKSSPAKVHHAEFWGLRGQKEAELTEGDLYSMEWAALEPTQEYFLFIPKDLNIQSEYEKGWKVIEIFNTHSTGIVTARDSLTICWTAKDSWETLQDFMKLPVEKAREKYRLGNDVRDWKVHLAQEDLKTSGPSKDKVVPVLYRPFDTRFTYYTGQTRGFICMPRPTVMPNMLNGENFGLITTRQTKETWQSFVCRSIIAHKSLAAYDINSLFPLYLYPPSKEAKGQMELGDSSPWPPGKNDRRPNLSSQFVKELAENIGLEFISDGSGDLTKTFGPEDVLHYIYAVFHSPTYRERYAEFLIIDFPRVPLTSDTELFSKLCARGKELVALHLMESPLLSKKITSYPIPGDDLVEKGHPRYLAPGEPEPGTGETLAAGRVYISKDAPKAGKKGQYFEGVPPEVCEFQVGGYQVCDKWLKDRKGRNLSYEDLTHYQKIVVALKETIRLMEEVDEVIEEHGGWPIE